MAIPVKGPFPAVSESNQESPRGRRSNVDLPIRGQKDCAFGRWRRKILPKGPTILSTRGTLPVHKASAATAPAPHQMVNTRSPPARQAQPIPSSLNFAWGGGGGVGGHAKTMTTSRNCQPLWPATAFHRSTEDGNRMPLPPGTYINRPVTG